MGVEDVRFLYGHIMFAQRVEVTFQAGAAVEEVLWAGYEGYTLATLRYKVLGALQGDIIVVGHDLRGIDVLADAVYKDQRYTFSMREAKWSDRSVSRKLKR